MIVCHCKGLSDRDVNAAALAGACDIGDVGNMCGAGTDCRGCHDRITAILDALPSRVPALKAS